MIELVDRSDYHADLIDPDRPSLSASVAHLLWTRSPLHAWTAHPRLNPNFVREDERRFDIGTAAHAIMLEAKRPEDVVRVIYMDSWRTNAAKELEADARENGLIPLLEKDAVQVYAMVDAAHAQLAARDVDPPLLNHGKPEQTLVWEEDGVLCRARLDWLRNDYAAIDDFKTTSASADPTRWIRTAFTIGADFQAAFYARGLKALTGELAPVRYVVQETYPPFALSVIEFGPDVLTVANAKIDDALAIWKECLATERWPGYPTKVCTAELPAWLEAEYLTKTAMREELAA